MAGRGNLLRQFLQQTTGESTSGSGSASGPSSDPRAGGDSGLDTNSPSMTIRSQGRGKILDQNISNSSSSDGAGALFVGGRGRAMLATIGRGSGESKVGDDDDSAVGSAIGSIPPLPPVSSGRGGTGRGNLLKCLQLLGDASLEEKKKPVGETSIVSLEKSKETSKDEAFSSMEVSVPEEVPRDPLIMKGKAGEFLIGMLHFCSFLLEHVEGQAQGFICKQHFSMERSRNLLFII